MQPPHDQCGHSSAMGDRPPARARPPPPAPAGRSCASIWCVWPWPLPGGTGGGRPPPCEAQRDCCQHHLDACVAGMNFMSRCAMLTMTIAFPAIPPGSERPSARIDPAPRPPIASDRSVGAHVRCTHKTFCFEFMILLYREMLGLYLGIRPEVVNMCPKHILRREYPQSCLMTTLRVPSGQFVSLLGLFKDVIVLQFFAYCS